MSHRFKAFEPWKGDLPARNNGALVAMETGTAVPYAIWKLQDRGTFFVLPNEDVYAGEVIGENTRSNDIVLNINKTKHLTNVRASGSDEALKLTPPVILSLEQALEFIADDELVEVTPKTIRLRKKILNSELRAKDRARKENN